MNTIPPPAPLETPPADTERPVLMYEFGPFQLDPIGRHLRKDGEILPLTAKVFETLLALVRHHDRPVSKEDLISAVWPGTFVSDDSLVQNISAIRKTLSDDPSQPRYIVTLARRGYRFIAPTIERTELEPGNEEDTTRKPETAHLPTAVTPLPTRAASPARWMMISAAFVLGLFVAGISSLLLARGSNATGEAPVRFQELIPPGQSIRGGAAISRDGRQIAFATQDSKGLRIWLRQLDSPEPRALPGTEGGTNPFWSPDGQFLGFVANGEMRRLELATGSIRAIAPTHRVRPLGVSWGANDVVLYADLGKIFAVSANGGTPTEVAGSSSGQTEATGELRWPQILADGKHFVFFASGESPEKSGTFLGELGSSTQVRLTEGVRATYAAPNHLLYVRDTALMSQAFDLTSGRLEGPPMAIPGEVSTSTSFSASANGVLVATDLVARHQLGWFDRSGKALESVNFAKELADVTLSPSGEMALAATLDAGTYELWLVDLVRSVSTKITTNATFPAWSPDGTRFAFTHVSADGADIYVRSVSGAPHESAWLATKELKAVRSWSPDNQFLVFSKYKTREQTSQDLWLLPTTGDRKPFVYLESKASERGGYISPNGQWIAYSSDESGTSEVYVQSFPTPGAQVRVSTLGGSQPVWRRDGRELFYVASDHRLMSVSLGSGTEFKPSAPQPLFSLPFVPSGLSRQFDATADGQRFLVVDGVPSGQDVRIDLLTNWTAARRP